MRFFSAFTLRFTLFLWIAASFASTSPTHHSGSSTSIHRVVRAVTRELVVDEDAGTVVDTNTQRRIDQGSASDGAGSGFNIPAVLWLSFGLAVGLYLTLGGMRLWRMTTAIAIGLILTICAWVAIVNTMNAQGLPDLILTLVTLGIFALGSLGGLFKLCRLPGLIALSVLGGMSVGMRVVLMREGLLLRPIGLNWVIIAVCTAVGPATTLFRQRIGIALSCTFTGTFLLALGIDLAVNQQNSVSRGLRHLLDVNDAHFLGLRELPYKPPMTTQIILGVSIGLGFVMAYVQLRFFGECFDTSKHAHPFAQHFPSLYPGLPTEKLDTDTLRLPLQRPPTCHRDSGFSLR